MSSVSRNNLHQSDDVQTTAGAVLHPDLIASESPDQSSHVVQVDADQPDQKKAKRKGYDCGVIQMILITQMLFTLHFTLSTWPNDDAHKIFSGFSFVGGFLLLICITAATWMNPTGNTKKILAAAGLLVQTIFVGTTLIWMITDHKLIAANCPYALSVACFILLCFWNACLIGSMNLPSEDVRVPQLSRTAIAQMTYGLTMQLLYALTIYLLTVYLVIAPLPQNWWIFTLIGNLLTLASLAFFTMSVYFKSRLLSILSSLIYLSAASVMIYKFCTFAMAVDSEFRPTDVTEMYCPLIYGAAHLSIMFGNWKLF